MPPENKLHFLPARLAPELPQPMVMKNGRIPFPQGARETIRRHPELESLVLEMAATDPKTFLHCVMAAECFVFMREEYVKRLPPNTDLKKLAAIDGFLRFQDTAALIHDIGKWTVTDDVKRSIAIVNSSPADGVNPYDLAQKNNGKIILDTRRTDDRNTHKLHPVTGVYTILALSSVNPFIPQRLIYEWAKPAAGHHEHFRDAIVTNSHEKLIPSYPRKELRLVYQYEDLFYLLLKMADTVAAMGQPRVYRNHRLPDKDINESLDNILTNYFVYLGKTIGHEEMEKNKEKFKKMAITALKRIQTRYPEEVCMNLMGFSNPDGQPYPPKKYQDGFLINNLAKQVWRKNRERLEMMKNGVIFPSPRTHKKIA